MKKITAISCFLSLALNGGVNGQQFDAAKGRIVIAAAEKSTKSQWAGKRVAFLGDSMTDQGSKATTCLYWQYLAELLGIETVSYGKSGNQWDGIYKQAVKLQAEKGNDIDAIVIFAGTNDYMHNTTIGQFYTETTRETNFNGNNVTRKYRTPVLDDSTFCGRINKVMSYLKANFPQQQIIVMTPIHRAFATFGQSNVQPDENYANEKGLYLESYVDIIRQAAGNWSVPLIDLYATSGLSPLIDEQAIYFHDAVTDRLHPNQLGNYRLAKTIQYQLLRLPSTFITK